MERFASLINSLKIKFESGAGSGELLMQLEEMKRELGSARPLSDHTNAPVSVWLPAGYSSRGSFEHSLKNELFHAEALPKLELPEDKSLAANGKNTSVQQDASASFQESDQIQEDIPVISPISAPIVHFGAPRPPVIAVMEEEEVTKEINIYPVSISENQETVELQKSSFFSPVLNEDNNNTGSVNDLANQMKDEVEEEALVLELDMPEEIIHNVPVSETSKNMRIPEGFLVSGRSQGPDTLDKPKELHEILAARVVAQPQNLPNKPKILAESLGGEKITDLKKGIAINDRFRFIKSLFRGDENLFDRSVKTINNFNILQEAEYWMQRELLIKLGWNEEDELVQQFYLLVRRRFL